MIDLRTEPRCDRCNRRMIEHEMSVADHLGWRLGLKCGRCYRESLFNDVGDRQRDAFDRLVVEATANAEKS